MSRRRNPQRQELLAAVIRQHRNATRKVSRLNREVGVEIAGRPQDVRRDLGKVRRYTAKQLAAYSRELQAFNSRDVQYARGSARKPLSGALWKEYQRVERQVNAQFNAAFQKYRHIPLPNRSETIEQRLWKFQVGHKAMAHQSVDAMFNPQQRSSRGVKNDKALEKLIDTTRAKLRPEYMSQRIAEERRQAEVMLDSVGDETLKARLDDLTDEQFFVLFEYAGFAESLALWYEIAKLAAARRQRWHDQVIDDQLELSHDLAKWARTLRFDS